MENKEYLNSLKEDLIKALILLLEHTKDKNSDAYKDFYPTKITLIEKAIMKLKHKPFSIENLRIISNILEFKRIFPLLEMAEKIRELKDTILKKQKITTDSYQCLGISKNKLEEISKNHEVLLTKFVLEGIFRKGVVASDNLAWSSIMYNMGGRIIYDYVYAVTNGWLHEDIIKEWLIECLNNLKGIKLISLKQSAHDSNRIFKYKKEKAIISGEPDFMAELEIKGKKLDFHVEVQHVTDRSRKKKENLIQVPNHRVKESKKYGKNYVFIVPYLNEEEKVETVGIVLGPLKEIKENYIEGFFFSPSEAKKKLEEFIFNLR